MALRIFVLINLGAFICSYKTYVFQIFINLSTDSSPAPVKGLIDLCLL